MLTSRRYQPSRERASPANSRQQARAICGKFSSSSSRPSSSSRLNRRTPIRTSTTLTIARPKMITHNTSYRAQNMIRLSPCTSRAMGITMNEASRLAARTLVVWVEMTTAPLTITVACTVVRVRI